MVIRGRPGYNPPMNTITPPASSGKDGDAPLPPDIRCLDSLTRPMAEASLAAQSDARARLAALHARIAQDIATLRENEACAPS